MNEKRLAEIEQLCTLAPTDPAFRPQAGPFGTADATNFYIAAKNLMPEFLSEVRRLRERERVLHEAVRQFSIERTGSVIGGRHGEQLHGYQCGRCLESWHGQEAEHHAPGCPAAPKDPDSLPGALPNSDDPAAGDHPEP